MAAELAQSFRDAADYGFVNVEPEHQWSVLVERRETYIRRLNGIYERNLNNRNVDWVTGDARFINKNTIEVDESIRLKALIPLDRMLSFLAEMPVDRYHDYRNFRHILFL